MAATGGDGGCDGGGGGRRRSVTGRGRVDGRQVGIARGRSALGWLAVALQRRGGDGDGGGGRGWRSSNCSSRVAKILKEVCQGM